MNIMVFNVPAETVGALSILNEFYDEVINDDDKNINWYFVLSKPKLKETSNIKVLRYEWIKRSWLHRIFFDYMVAPALIKKYKIDKIISFQNIVIPRTKIKQVLYIHNGIPFTEYKFSLFKNKKLWLYQNVISKKIFSSIKKSEKTLVQTEWIKEACIKKTNIDSKDIVVVAPSINIEVKSFFKNQSNSFKLFFYPASEFIFKNHEVIVNACMQLKDAGIRDYQIIFTLTGDENDHIRKLYNQIKEHELPIKFIGSISRKQVFEYYSNTILLFPSYLETFGLPLLEARMHKCVIIASDSEFSHEVLSNYDNSYFFNPFDRDELSKIMISLMENQPYYHTNEMLQLKHREKIIDLIAE